MSKSITPSSNKSARTKIWITVSAIYINDDDKVETAVTQILIYII